MENAENALVLLYDLCRLCLDEPGVDNIFKPVDWTRDILTYTGIKVTPSDNLPQTICSSCRDIMACVKILKDISTANNEHLQLIKGSNDNQNEPSEVPEISSSSMDIRKSLKNKIVFESEGEGSKSQIKKHKKKRKTSSSKTENVNNVPSRISVRKDLLDISTIVASSTNQIKQSSTSGHSEDTDTENMTSSEKSIKTSPSSTTGHIPKKIKTLTVGGKEFKVFEYDYKCETCNKSYATPKKLYLHQLAHNKKFICPLDACSKKFATKGDLQKHTRSHTGEKPYKCDLCDQSFTQNVSLRSHKEKIHVDS